LKPQPCRLCQDQSSYFVRWQRYDYFRCERCKLIQRSRFQLPTAAEERAEYDLHRNDPKDQGYRRFLSKVTNPTLDWLQENVAPSVSILDFGCGPGPTISTVLGEKGWVVRNYDPMFAPDVDALDHYYDLITCTEVVEHFFDPIKSWSLLCSLLVKGGHLVVMTEPSDRYYSADTFQDWGYIREQSHVTFYHSDTMRWLAGYFRLHMNEVQAGVYWFTRLS
jgi:hypothetical protein